MAAQLEVVMATYPASTGRARVERRCEAAPSGLDRPTCPQVRRDRRSTVRCGARERSALALSAGVRMSGAPMCSAVEAMFDVAGEPLSGFAFGRYDCGGVKQSRPHRIWRTVALFGARLRGSAGRSV